MTSRRSEDQLLAGRDAEGNLPAPELTDAEVEARISEKLAMQREMAERRGTRTGADGPTAKPVTPTAKVDPAEQAALDAELAEAQAAIAGLEAAEKEARKAEAEILAKADAQRKDRRQALIDHAEAIRSRVAEVEERARSQKLSELSIEMTGAAARNAAASEATLDAQRAELERMFRPILNEIKATMTESKAFLAEHGDALRRLSEQTFSTTDVSFPIRTRQKLSAEVFRPAERLLEYVNQVMACDTGHGGRWDTTMEASIRSGKLVTGESLAATLAFSKHCTRDHVTAWRQTVAQIALRLEQLTQQGRAQAMAQPEIRITIDDTARQNAKRNAQYGTLTTTRQTTAEFGDIE